MKSSFSFTFFLSILFTVQSYPQWQMMNSPLATPDTRMVVYHPNGYILVITNHKEVFRSETNIEEWNRIATLDSAVKCLVVGPEGFIYAGIIGGYIYSTDFGFSWNEKIFLQNKTHRGYVSDIVFNSSGHIFMSTFYESPTSGVWKSTDGGISWIKYSNGLNGYWISSLCTDGFNNVYALTHFNEIFKTTDGGQNWQLKEDMGGLANTIRKDFNNNFYIASNIGIYKSTNFGDSWYEVFDSWVENLYIDNVGNIYGFNQSSYSSLNYIIFSSNGGSIWQNIGLVGLSVYGLININDTIYAGTNRGLRKSSNLGNQWKLSFQYQDKYANVKDILILSSQLILAGTNEGLFTSDDSGYSWDTTSVESNVYRIKEDRSENIYAAAGFVYLSTDNGASWLKRGVNYPNPIVNFSINDSNHVFVLENGSQSVFVFRSKDLGVSWEMLASILYYNDQICVAYGIAHNKDGSAFISYHGWGWNFPGGYWIDDKILKRFDNQYPWITVTNDKIIQSIHFLNDTMYLATQDEGIYKSYDDGYTLIPLNNGLTSNNVKQIILTPDVFICLTDNGIYRSLDKGEYWMKLDLSGLSSTEINRIYYSDNGTLYACTNNGIGVFAGDLPVELLSLTGKVEKQKVILSWSTASELNNHGFEIQRKFESNEWITIGFKDGIGTSSEQNNYSFVDDVFGISAMEFSYRLKQIDFDGTYSYSDEIKVSLNPVFYELSQNYPNPFNPSTVIKYSIVDETNVNITVFDVLGNEVKILVNEKKKPGHYELEFNGEGLTSGVYFYRLQIDNFVSIKKMIIVK